MEIGVSSSNGTWIFRETALTLWERRRVAAAAGGGALDLGSVAVPLLEVDLKEAVAIFIGINCLNLWKDYIQLKEIESFVESSFGFGFLFCSSLISPNN